MDFAALAAECAPWVAPQTMAAIVKTESQFKPFAININGGAKLERQPANKEEAVVTAKWLLANNYNIDLGLGQVNSVNLAKTNLSVEDAFDSCKNLAASATILQGNYDSASKRIPGEQAALHAAISAYNTGSFTRGFSNGYVQKVVNNARDFTPQTITQTLIQPIPLVNLGKFNVTKTVTANTDAVKLTIAKADVVTEVTDMPKINTSALKLTNISAVNVPAVKQKSTIHEKNQESASQFGIDDQASLEQSIMVYK